MKQVCIHFSKIFNVSQNCEHGCNNNTRVHCVFCCGLIGIPQIDNNDSNDQNDNKDKIDKNNVCEQVKQLQPDMKTLYQLLNHTQYNSSGITTGVYLD